MKKFLSAFACLAMILVGGIALSGCGDEFAKGEDSSVAEITAFVNDETTENTLTTGYIMNCDFAGVKMEGTVSVIEEKLQAKFFVNIPENEILGDALSGEMFLKDDTVYIKSSNSNKIKVTMDTQDPDYQGYVEQLQMALNFQTGLDDMINETISSFNNPVLTDASVKKLVNGDSVKFRFLYDGLGGKVSLILGYKNHVLTEFSMSEEIMAENQLVKINMNIKSFSGEISFPSDLDTYSEPTQTPSMV